MHAVRLRLYPDVTLRKRCRPYRESEMAQALETARLMLEVMYARRGIGLAGPQVGIRRRLFVLDVSEEKDVPVILINPRLASTDGRIIEAEEGCLSFPGLYAPVSRHAHAVVEYMGADGEAHTLEGEGFLARVVQHETDHLDGILFIDRVGPAWQAKLRSALKELASPSR